MACQRCGSDRVANFSGKTSDLCSWGIGTAAKHGYVPGDMGVGSGDYLEFDVCLQCGQMQGTYPLPPCALEQED